MVTSSVPEVRRKNEMALLQPLRSRSFTFFWLGETASRFGDEFQTIALATVAIALTGKGSALAQILFVQYIPFIVLTLFGGMAVDRFGARRVMIATNTLLGLAALGLTALAATTPLKIAYLYAYSLLIGLIRPFFQPASFAMPAELVEREKLPAANSLYRMGLDISRFAAAPVAGALVAGAGAVWAFAVNSYSFFQAAALQTFIRGGEAKPRGPDAPRGARQIVEGYAVVRANVILLRAMVFNFVWFLGFMGAFQVGIASLAQITFQAGPRGQGIMMAAIGIGNLVGTLAAGSARAFRKYGVLALAIGSTFGVCFLIAALSTGVVQTVVPLFIAGAVNAFGYVAIVVLFQTQAPADRRGSVMGMLILVSMGSYPFSYALAGIVSALWGPRAVMIVLGSILPFVACMVCYVSPEVRRFTLTLR
jgi:MFS family permease